MKLTDLHVACMCSIEHPFPLVETNDDQMLTCVLAFGSASCALPINVWDSVVQH